MVIFIDCFELFQMQGIGEVTAYLRLILQLIVIDLNNFLEIFILLQLLENYNVSTDFITYFLFFYTAYHTADSLILLQ